jgi:hypothetical protein
VLNVTAVGATAQTDVRVWPTRPGPPPTVSNLNPPPRSDTPAAIVAAIGEDGTVSLRSSAGSVHLVVDLSGWYVPSPGGDVSPVRTGRCSPPGCSTPAAAPRSAPARPAP